MLLFFSGSERWEGFSGASSALQVLLFFRVRAPGRPQRCELRVQPGVVYTTFHFPGAGANVITTENSDWATNCPEYRVTAVQVTRASQPWDWQQRHKAFDSLQEQLLPEAD